MDNDFLSNFINSYIEPIEDGNDNSDAIIPPSSILDGSAPVAVFMEYVKATDLSKVGVRDYLVILHWICELTGKTPDEINRMAEENANAS